MKYWQNSGRGDRKFRKTHTFRVAFINRFFDMLSLWLMIIDYDPVEYLPKGWLYSESSRMHQIQP